MGCCCSCCKEPRIEVSRNPPRIQQTPQHVSATDRTNPIVLEERPPFDDDPPPYESNVRSSVFGSRDTLGSENTSSQTETKDLPHLIPLTSPADTGEGKHSLAAAYAEQFERFGISSEQYLEFLSGLDRGLFASPDAEPGSVSAYINSMFQSQGASQVVWLSSATAASLARSVAYVSSQNHELFGPAGLAVELLDTEEMKLKIDTWSQAQMLRADGNQKLSEIEYKRKKEQLKLEQRLLTSRTLEKQQKAMQKFLEKDNKYNLKAMRAIAKYEDQAEKEINEARAARMKSRAEPAQDHGVYWLLVTESP